MNSQPCAPSFQRDIAVEHALHAFVVGELAAGEQRQRAERQALLQEEAPLDVRLSSRAMRLDHFVFMRSSASRPVIMVGKVRGTSTTIDDVHDDDQDDGAMAKKCR